MRTYDEYGVEWAVMTRDPAIKLVRGLNKLGYEWIILPRLTYITGQVERNMVEWNSPITSVEDVRLRECVVECVP